MFITRVSNKVFKAIEFPFLVISSQLKQNECESLKDNILLWKLRYRAPRYFDRDLEYPWTLRNIIIKRGKLLDIGSTVGAMLYDKLPKTIKISTLNINVQKDVANVDQIEGDIRSTDLKSNLFDCITCISTLEHIGVEGRYGVKKDAKGDIKAMKEMHRLLKKNGSLILTVPYGSKDVLPINKLYNKRRMQNLFKGYKVERAEYQKYDSRYKLWFTVSEEEAAKTDWLKEPWYALGLFVLRKK